MAERSAQNIIGEIMAIEKECRDCERAVLQLADLDNAERRARIRELRDLLTLKAMQHG